MNKHFILTNDTIIHNGIRLYRIEAIRDTLHANKGDIGGYIQSIHNLHDEAWVGGDAMVRGYVCKNAHVCGFTKVSGNHMVFGTLTNINLRN